MSSCATAVSLPLSSHLLHILPPLISIMAESKPNPFSRLLTKLEVGSSTYQYYSLPSLSDPRIARLPYSIKVLLESAVRNCDDFAIKAGDIENILAWEQTSQRSVEIPFKPARVLMQDFTGVPAVVDLAAMRNAMARLGGDPARINPLVPADLVVDHSVQVDFYRSPDALEGNLRKEMERNSERFAFLKWGSQVSDTAHITYHTTSSPLHLSHPLPVYCFPFVSPCRTS